MEDLGSYGEIDYPISEADTPIAHEAMKFYESGPDRLEKHGRNADGFAAVTQSNFAAVIRAIAKLELEVKNLRDG